MRRCFGAWMALVLASACGSNPTDPTGSGGSSTAGSTMGPGGSSGSGGHGGTGGTSTGGTSTGGQGGTGGGAAATCETAGAWSAVSLASYSDDRVLSARADSSCRVMAAWRGKNLDLGTGVQSGWLVLANFDADGSLSFVRNVVTGGSSTPQVYSAFVAPAPGQGFVVAANITGDVDMGGGVLPPIDYLYPSLIVARYDASGAFVSASRYGEHTSYDVLEAVDVDSAGNVYAVGQLNGALNPDSGQPSDIVKLAPDGSLLWSREFGNTLDDAFIVGAAVGADDGLIVWGYLEGQVDFGGGLIGDPYDDLGFVLKLTADGDHVFSRTLPIIESPAADYSPRTAATPDLSGGVWVSGAVFFPVDIGNGPEGTGGLLLAHLDGTGALVAADIIGTSGSPIEAPRHMTVLPSGDVVLAGQLAASFDFGGGLTGDGSYPELFVARYDEAIIHQESFTIGDGKILFAHADPAGGVVLGGQYKGKLTWAGTSHSSVSSEDAFVARLPPSP